MILKFCIDKTFKDKKVLYVTAVDFAKAYDSVKRDSLIKTLMDYKIHPNLIDIVTGTYIDDRTNIVTGGETEMKMTVSSGIRQGCTASTTLFKLLTYVIIDRLQKGGFRDDNFKLRTSEMRRLQEAS